MKLKDLIKELNLFERKRTPMEIRIVGIATYIQTSSTSKNPFRVSPSISHSNLEMDKED